MPTPKDPEAIRMEFYAKPFSNGRNLNWFRESMRSLLEYVEGEMPKRVLTENYVREQEDKKQFYTGEDRIQDTLIIQSRNRAISDCIAKIREIKDSI